MVPELEAPAWKARPAKRARRGSRTDPQDESREPLLGRTTFLVLALDRRRILQHLRQRLRRANEGDGYQAGAFGAAAASQRTCVARLLYIGAERTWACKRIRQGRAPSNHRTPGGSSRSLRWAAYIIVTSAGPPEARDSLGHQVTRCVAAVSFPISTVLDYRVGARRPHPGHRLR